MRRFQITVGSEKYDIAVASSGESYAIEVNGRRRGVDVRDVARGRIHMLVEGVSREVDYRQADDGWRILLDGYEFHADTLDYHIAALRRTAGVTHAARMSKELRAPMPGLTLRIAVGVGDTIAKGDTLLILEAMKMENIIKATGEGVVQKVLVGPQTSVEKGEVLIVFE